VICLDAWAIIAFLTDDDGANEVADVIESGAGLMSWINLGEVAYVLTRRDGEPKAREAVGDLAAGLRVESPGPDLVLRAAAIKAVWPMSYADAFAAATALGHRAELLTADPEILAASAALGLRARPPAY
jgi:predicted nucleic acid-binding protein